VKDFGIAVPICASVSRKTGEIRFEYSRDEQDVIRFGRVMNRLSRIQEAFEDEEARKKYTGADTFRGAASEQKFEEVKRS